MTERLTDERHACPKPDKWRCPECGLRWRLTGGFGWVIQAAPRPDARTSDEPHQPVMRPLDALHATAVELEQVTAERDELRWRLDAVEARHTPVAVRYGDAPDELACRACGTHYEYPVAWPCPTVKAARGEKR